MGETFPQLQAGSRGRWGAAKIDCNYDKGMPTRVLR